MPLVPTHGPNPYPRRSSPQVLQYEVGQYYGPTPHGPSRHGPTPYPQVLQYEVGQYYGGHHDFIPAHSRLPCGPRVYTLFMYLSEVRQCK